MLARKITFVLDVCSKNTEHICSSTSLVRVNVSKKVEYVSRLSKNVACCRNWPLRYEQDRYGICSEIWLRQCQSSKKLNNTFLHTRDYNILAEHPGQLLRQARALVPRLAWMLRDSGASEGSALRPRTRHTHRRLAIRAVSFQCRGSRSSFLSM